MGYSEDFKLFIQDERIRIDKEKKQETERRRQSKKSSVKSTKMKDENLSLTSLKMICNDFWLLK